jgi:beta-glucosidase
MPNQPIYRDARRRTAARIDDLLGRMTIEEKAGQLVSTCPVNQVRPAGYDDAKVLRQAKRLIDRGVGQLGAAVRHSAPAHGPRLANAIQRYAREHTRLGIPVLLQDECVHGCKAYGSTMFPQSISLAASWNVDLMERVTHVIGRETRARGLNQCFSPTLNIARDVRCGRVEETYGEDPYLVSRMGVAFIKTLQEYGVAATPKHFVANFVGDGGRDSHAVHFSERLLREVYFPAFKAAVQEAGTQSLMIAHTAIDGVPCSNNRWLMQTILRDEWGFEGFIVPDNTDVQKNFSVHSQADSYAQSTQWCIEAGLDTDLSWPPPPPRLCYLDWIPKLVRERKLSEATVDTCVSRVLKAKFDLGLFENPYVDEGAAVQFTRTREHRAVALDAALQGMVLLKNDGALPLARSVGRIAVLGPSASKTRLGGYTCDGAEPVTPLEGLRERAPTGVEIRHVEGCKLVDPSRRGFAAAVRAAKWADVVVLCMGNSSDKIIGQPETTEGERHDRCDLDLPGVQEDFIREIAALNRHTVVVLQNGSAVTMQGWIGDVNAVLEAWYAGSECGHAIAEVLFGDHNPAGRLPITFPTTTGQCPLYYNPRPHGRVSDYCDHRGPLEQFAFGYGLSYSRFEYSGLRVRKTGKGRCVKVDVTCTIRNAGRRAGDEVVQLYLRDCYSRISRPIKELRGFERIHLKRGESGRVAFTLGWDDFAYLGEDMKPVLEPGDFKIMVGASSADIRLERSLRL